MKEENLKLVYRLFHLIESPGTRNSSLTERKRELERKLREVRDMRERQSAR
jgi:hypothetical protein